ncbi:thiamine-phosphate kinase [Horticoccus luteus]|uniref:Thiamine-monophosphate kinase n=1 Tax=Horticoccus luteus TaxID=2862869 RepID=A0A8F9TS00_9BACT|nr:thiamine-phosphate kinase [Horticoccus luteus]QYM77940.1 thiamine-phosphate kinase [Horticoccus luteus]
MDPFAARPDDAVGGLGEERLITAIRRWLGTASPRAPFGIGDDCAVLPAVAGRQLITVDPVIYGRHFDATIAPRSVGAKLLKRNLSDLAAMGGRPTAAVLALTLDAKVSVWWLEGFYRGLAACARRYRVPVVGGDVAQANGVLAASLTLLGTAAAGRTARVISRRGAAIGDWIYVTGTIGGSVASGHHWRFTPRLEEGAWLARRADVRAMMDVSDGLAKDLHALTPRGAEPALQAAALPRRAGASVAAALSEGEDYELALAVARTADRAGLEKAWRRQFRTRLTCIGRFVTVGQRPADAVDLAAFRGYEHLAGGV